MNISDGHERADTWRAMLFSTGGARGNRCWCATTFDWYTGVHQNLRQPISPQNRNIQNLKRSGKAWTLILHFGETLEVYSRSLRGGLWCSHKNQKIECATSAWRWKFSNWVMYWLQLLCDTQKSRAMQDYRLREELIQKGDLNWFIGTRGISLHPDNQQTRRWWSEMLELDTEYPTAMIDIGIIWSSEHAAVSKWP